MGKVILSTLTSRAVLFFCYNSYFIYNVRTIAFKSINRHWNFLRNKFLFLKFQTVCGKKSLDKGLAEKNSRMKGLLEKVPEKAFSFKNARKIYGGKLNNFLSFLSIDPTRPPDTQ